MNPWPGKAVSVTENGAEVDFKLDTSNGECIVFKAAAGHEYEISKK
jgi:hypothetical protein